MDGRGVVLHLVVHGDLEDISPVAFNGGAWNLSIDCKSKLGTRAVEVECRVGDGKIIAASLSALVACSVSIDIDGLAIAPFASIPRSVTIPLWKGLVRCSDIGS